MLISSSRNIRTETLTARCCGPVKWTHVVNHQGHLDLGPGPGLRHPCPEAARAGGVGGVRERPVPGGASPLPPPLLRDAYALDFLDQKSTEDLVVRYPYKKLGCPLLVYYDIPWKPVVEL